MKTNIAFKYASTESIESVISEYSGNTYKFRRFTYGVLVPDMNHPLVNVSIANSSLSIDIWKGCSLQCAYCHVQDSYMDINEDGKMPTRIVPRSQFTIEEILNALEKHPYFVIHETILSIGTASTEPFAAKAKESTFLIMEDIIRRKWQNPIWIVTKAGFPKDMGTRLKKITKTNKVMLSFCWAANPNEIEPAKNDRFANIKEAHDAGATCAWYMRPLAKDWGASPAHIECMMQWVILKGYNRYIHIIIAGGLRWTHGIEYGLVEVHKLKMPDIAKKDNEKDLDENIWQAIFNKSNVLFPNTPIYRKSSCALTYMISKPDIKATYNKDRFACLNSLCPKNQRGICDTKPVEKWSLEKAQELFNRLSIPCIIMNIENGEFVTKPVLDSFGTTINNFLQRIIAFGPEILEKHNLNF